MKLTTYQIKTIIEDCMDHHPFIPTLYDINDSFLVLPLDEINYDILLALIEAELLVVYNIQINLDIPYNEVHYIDELVNKIFLLLN